MFLYSIYDRVSGSYSVPLCFENEAVAKRAFPSICVNHPQYKMYPEDLDLFKVGGFDTYNGTVIPLERPEFVMRYVQEVANE